MRLMKCAAERDAPDGVGNLHRRDDRRSLADRNRNRLARIPFLVEYPFLPGFRRYQADIFTRQIDAGLASQAQLGGVVRDAIYTQQLSDVKKIDVARMDDRVVQIHFAMRRFLSIMENASVKFSV